MSVFIFDDYREFGLFFKINSSKLLELSSAPEFHEKVNEYIKIFDHTKGGCGCNLNKRRKAAADNYELFVPEFFTDPIPIQYEIVDGLPQHPTKTEQISPLGASVVAAVKDLLGGPTSINFKKEAADTEPFFKI